MGEASNTTPKPPFGEDMGATVRAALSDAFRAGRASMRDDAAAVVAVEHARILATQRPTTDPMGMDAQVNTNLRMMAVMLPEAERQIREIQP